MVTSSQSLISAAPLETPDGGVVFVVIIIVVVVVIVFFKAGIGKHFGFAHLHSNVAEVHGSVVLLCKWLPFFFYRWKDRNVVGDWGKKGDGEEERVHVASFRTKGRPTLRWFVSRGFFEYALTRSIGRAGDEDGRRYN